jgi:hypothetical protein
MVPVWQCSVRASKQKSHIPSHLSLVFMGDATPNSLFVPLPSSSWNLEQGNEYLCGLLQQVDLLHAIFFLVGWLPINLAA